MLNSLNFQLKILIIVCISRFTRHHEMSNRVLSITQNCFNKCDVQVFNDVALNAVNIIYKVNSFVNFLITIDKYNFILFFQLTIKPDETCMILIKKLYVFMDGKKNGKINNFIFFSKVTLFYNLKLFVTIKSHVFKICSYNSPNYFIQMWFCTDN